MELCSMERKCVEAELRTKEVESQLRQRERELNSVKSRMSMMEQKHVAQIESMAMEWKQMMLDHEAALREKSVECERLQQELAVEQEARKAVWAVAQNSPQQSLKAKEENERAGGTSGEVMQLTGVIRKGGKCRGRDRD
eukprot:TRINITY_DN4987_c0_g3_i1.p1 TRINITY_DN4987_c0_g3~~TRINITY_DN4987_c0_g3_i1.p1  ORF type:complete len:139 (-),score=32.49 TRINITY_DN4987_c0_g3_i1:818-1234(-)